MPGRDAAERALAEVLAGVSAAGGGDRFGALARHLAGALAVPMALVAELAPAGRPRALGWWGPDAAAAPALETGPGSLCATILAEGRVLQASGAAPRFPADPGLAALGGEGLAGRALRDAAGAPAGLVIAVDRAPLDWTPAAEAALGIFAAAAELELQRSRSESRLSLLARNWVATLDALPDLVAVIDTGFRLLRVNRALARLVSAHPRDLIGSRCHRVLHGLDLPWPGCPHLLALEQGASVSREIDDPRIGRPLLVTCTPFFADDGALLGTIHVARDISEQRESARLREQLIGELREALARVKLLSGMLPICSVCKRIRDDQGYWEQVEVFIREHSEADFTHGLCPACARELYPDYYRPP